MPNARAVPRVLVCDDERHVLRALKVVMRDAGFETLPAGGVADALQLARLRRPDAAILDLVLPDGDGVGLCRALRHWTDIPILLLSAVDDEERKVSALEAGADDYVTKPFSPRELVARLGAVLRRSAPARDDPVVRAEGLEVDLAARAVRRCGEHVHLTPTEFDLLRALVRNRGRLLTHRALLQEVWGPGSADDLATLRTTIARLRRKIEPPGEAGPRYIQTDAGVGYRFVAEA
jgi:two-component system KDP operon response regulator KdpE